jgi:predicted HTH transcriptional regulator
LIGNHAAELELTRHELALPPHVRRERPLLDEVRLLIAKCKKDGRKERSKTSETQAYEVLCRQYADSGSPVSREMIQKEVDMRSATLGRALARLVERGLATKLSRGVYVPVIVKD